MKKIVLSASMSLEKEVKKFVDKLKNEYDIVEYPKPIDEKSFLKDYPKVHTDFFKNITDTDELLVLNLDRKGISGYIGAEAFAELCFAVSLNLVYGKNIKAYIFKMPDKSVECYDEIKLWLSLGWIKLWGQK